MLVYVVLARDITPLTNIPLPFNADAAHIVVETFHHYCILYNLINSANLLYSAE